jgi:uncharacterized protein (TIGR02147 family)
MLMHSRGNSLLRAKLAESLAEIKSKNSSYSLRSFAKKLDIHPAALSEFINGKRSVSAQKAEALLKKLMIAPNDVQKIVQAFGADDFQSDLTPAIELKMDQFQMIADWQHFAIMSILEVKNPPRTTKSISTRLGISIRYTESALQRLERLSLIRKDSRGYSVSGEQYNSADEVSDISIKKHHIDGFELAKKALETLPLSQRDFYSITISANPDKLPEAKKLIRKFQEKLQSIMQTGNTSEVFRLCVQLFPLSKPEEEN